MQRKWSSLGDALRELRTRRGLTQAAVCTGLSIKYDVRSYRRIEAGQCRPSRSMVLLILRTGFNRVDLPAVDVATINTMLTKAGYETLREKQLAGNIHVSNQMIPAIYWPISDRPQYNGPSLGPGRGAAYHLIDALGDTPVGHALRVMAAESYALTWLRLVSLIDEDQVRRVVAGVLCELMPIDKSYLPPEVTSCWSKLSPSVTTLDPF